MTCKSSEVEDGSKLTSCKCARELLAQTDFCHQISIQFYGPGLSIVPNTWIYNPRLSNGM